MGFVKKVCVMPACTIPGLHGPPASLAVMSYMVR